MPSTCKLMYCYAPIYRASLCDEHYATWLATGTLPGTTKKHRVAQRLFKGAQRRHRDEIVRIGVFKKEDGNDGSREGTGCLDC